KSPCASTATRGSVTAAASTRAAGSSAKIEAGSPTRPSTTSFRAGGGVAQAESSYTTNTTRRSGAVARWRRRDRGTARISLAREAGALVGGVGGLVVRMARRDRGIDEVGRCGVAADADPADEVLVVEGWTHPCRREGLDGVLVDDGRLRGDRCRSGERERRDRRRERELGEPRRQARHADA